MSRGERFWDEAATPIHARRGFRTHIDRNKFPDEGMTADEAYELLHTGLMLDGRETLNLASFVTTWMEPEAERLIHETIRKNHIDHENVVFGAETHVVWDKFAKYFDVEMRKIPMKPDRFTIAADDLEGPVDENTIAVGAVLGTTHIGESDPIPEINDWLVRLKADKGWDVPLHVDGASGGFIAPFAHPDYEFDFRLEQVASINASGHKYGLVYPGVGWLIFRDRSKLPEDLIFSVNYLGGAQPTYTFNFSRGSAMIQAQMYNFIRLGRPGYTDIVQTMLDNANFLNEELGKTGRFEILNPGLTEPVVTFKLKGDPGFDVYHLSSRLREDGWIVPAYSLPADADDVHLMRIVCRIDLSRQMAEILLLDLMNAVHELEAEQPRAKTSRKADLWTAPGHAAAHAKARIPGR
jgi:glutamate decarboxylase